MPNYRGLDIPFVSFSGADSSRHVTSDDLFCAKEQALFDFYERHAGRYVRALDIGANIGVHTCLMRRHWLVRAFEPDPELFALLRENCERNKPFASQMLEVNRAAVSDHDGEETFVRLRDNMTGSHLKGDKTPYGPLEEFTVPVVDCRPLFAWADFAKIDCEGHEARLLTAVSPHACQCEFMVEVGNEANAEAIFAHFYSLRQMWAQKSGWQLVRALDEMPKHHSEGALFIGAKPFA